MKKVLLYILYLLVVWGGFRYFFDFSDVVEEMMFKPVIWLVPLFWWNVSIRNKVSFFGGSWLKSILYGLLVGGFYFVLIATRKVMGEITADLIGVVAVTAVIEEMVFSGFVLGYLRNQGFSEMKAVIVTCLLTVIVRIPILMFGYKLGMIEGFSASLFIFATSIVSGYVRVRSGNVSGSILARFALNLATVI